MHLVDHARAHIAETGSRSLKDRAMRKLLAAVLPYPNRFRLALKLVPLGQPFRGLLSKLGLKELGAMLDLAPRQPLTKAALYAGPGTAVTQGERKKRVILLAGCAQQVLRPDINDATIRLLARSGVEVEVAAGAGCCGALSHHMGKEQAAIEFAKANIDAWTKAMERGPVDAVIINASGCGTMVKDYGHLLKHAGGDYAVRAQRISDLTRDITEFVAATNLGPAKRWSSIRVAYHSACSLQHGQQIVHVPKALLKRAGFSVVDVPEGHICCGSAGTYNILQPELAGQLRARKVENIKSVRPDVIAAGNLGCITQIGLGIDIPIVHTVELLDWAHGGPVPNGLAALEQHMTNVPAPAIDDYIRA
jgi:glycolate oxidase iron-sulfur subunit